MSTFKRVLYDGSLMIALGFTLLGACMVSPIFYYPSTPSLVIPPGASVHQRFEMAEAHNAESIKNSQQRIGLAAFVSMTGVLLTALGARRRHSTAAAKTKLAPQ